jgi:hypothetical protein
MVELNRTLMRSWSRTNSQRVVPAERRDPSPLASKVKKGLCSSAETRLRAAAMSAIALIAGAPAFVFAGTTR